MLKYRRRQCGKCDIAQFLFMYLPDMPSKCLPCRIRAYKHLVIKLEEEVEALRLPRMRWDNAQLKTLIQIMVYGNGDIGEVAFQLGKDINHCRDKCDQIGIPRRKDQGATHSDATLLEVYRCLYVECLSPTQTAKKLRLGTANVVIGIRHRHFKGKHEKWQSLLSALPSSQSASQPSRSIMTICEEPAE